MSCVTPAATPKDSAVPHLLQERLRCLDCHHHPLSLEGEALLCPACGARFPARLGIPSLLAGGPEAQEWNDWSIDEVKMSGASYYKRAKGELPEKEASKSYARLMKRRGLYRAGDTVLDLGCAAGHFLRSFRRLLDPDIRYTGIDSELQFLLWGREVFGVDEKVNFVHADVLDMPFVDDAFDVVVVNLFHFFPRIDQALAEAMRVGRRLVLWRTPIGEVNYAIKVIYDQDFAEVGVITPERSDFNHCLYMLYSEEYLRGLIPHLGGEILFIERDTDFQPFDNTVYEEFSYMPATKVVGDMQVNGNLILDWQYVAIDCSRVRGED